MLKWWIGQVLIYLICNLSMKSVGKSVAGINTRIARPGPPQNLYLYLYLYFIYTPKFLGCSFAGEALISCFPASVISDLLCCASSAFCDPFLH